MMLQHEPHETEHAPASPATTAISEKLLSRAEDLATELTGVIRQTEPFYDAGDTVSARDLRASVLDNLICVLSQLAGHPAIGYEPSRATGRRRAEQGAPLPAILHSYRIAAKFIWKKAIAEASGDPVATQALLKFATELWLTIDEMSNEVTDAYRDTVAERARSDEQTRNAMLDVLLRGELGDGSRLWECTTCLRLPQQGTFVIVVAGSPGPAAQSVPHAEQTLRTRGIRSAWRVEMEAHVGLVALTKRAGIQDLCALLTGLTKGPVGISEQYTSLEQTPLALRQARLAYAAAGPTGNDIVRYDLAPIAVLLASAPDSAAAVAQSILGPVLSLPVSERDILLKTLRGWFTEEGATATAAAKLHLHRNTVRYRLRRVEDLTGRSLTQPTGVAELYLALEATRILRLQGMPASA